MIKVYGMDSCPDCIKIKDEILKRKDEFEYIDIGTNVRLLKEFIRLRDNSNVFDEAKKNGSIGIPCFVMEDGSITLNPMDVNINVNRSSCSLEDHLLGKKGC